MQIFLVTIVLFGLIMAAMSLGVIFSNRSLKGSCGGTGQDCACDEEAQATCALKREMSEA